MSKKHKQEKQKPEQQKPDEEREFLQAFVISSRIYSAVIIVALLVQGLTKWMSEDISRLVIILMAIFIFLDSFKLYLRGKKIRPFFYVMLMILFLCAAFIISRHQ
ncbi:MAG TPA: hypothetical protein DCK76_12880 [Desulfotomaculum sp.]|nr:MAG: hypothetical protein XD78_2132 [Desulfotomaculum sp. 46_296]HAG12223.1 hypothetical protein [Desulfotomaculum sp.]HBY05270.1 hypothetical protein [Desulfotomaculum sp.]